MSETRHEVVSKWNARGHALLEQALSEDTDGRDAIPTVSAALTAMRIAAGEVDPSAMDGYPFPGEEESDEGCICTPDQLARGGFRGGCPVHGFH